MDQNSLATLLGYPDPNAGSPGIGAIPGLGALTSPVEGFNAAAVGSPATSVPGNQAPGAGFAGGVAGTGGGPLDPRQAAIGLEAMKMLGAGNAPPPHLPTQSASAPLPGHGPQIQLGPVAKNNDIDPRVMLTMAQLLHGSGAK